FYESGGIMVEGNFEGGEKTGEFTEYHESGALARKITYVTGMRHGPVQVFDGDGKKCQTASNQNDKLTDSIQLYFDNGNVKRESFFVKGKPEGLVKEYYPSGKPKKEITYKNGKPNGITRTFYENGMVETEANYAAGIMTGFYKTY